MANEQYYQQAKDQYDPAYNSKVQSLKNQLAQNQQALEQQKTGINSNYDKQVSNQNLNNKMNKNNVSNAMLGRGLGNSSIAVSGLAEQDAKNTRLVGDINEARTGDLNNIDQQKSLLAQNMNNTLAQMEGDRESAIRELARQLYGEDWTRNFQTSQLAQQKQLQEAQLAYQYAQMAQSKELSNAQLAFDREKWNASQVKQTDNSDLNSFIDAYGTTMADSSLSNTERENRLKALYSQATLYDKVNGTNIGSTLYDQYKANPVKGAFYDTYQSYQNNSSSKKKTFLGGLIGKK